MTRFTITIRQWGAPDLIITVEATDATEARNKVESALDLHIARIISVE